jgi:hypothetical protein
MTDVILVLVIVAFFVGAALLVRVLGRMIDASGYDADFEDVEDPDDSLATQTADHGLTPGRPM